MENIDTNYLATVPADGKPAIINLRADSTSPEGEVGAVTIQVEAGTYLNALSGLRHWSQESEQLNAYYNLACSEAGYTPGQVPDYEELSLITRKVHGEPHEYKLVMGIAGDEAGEIALTIMARSIQEAVDALTHLAHPVLIDQYARSLNAQLAAQA